MNGFFIYFVKMGKYKRKIQLEMVELEEGSLHLLVDAGVPAHENCWWVVDTGASKSVIDKAVAPDLVGEESAGSKATGLGKELVETSMGRIDQFILGGYLFEALQVAIVDLHHINEEYARYSDKKIIGLLGSDFFYREKAMIDYAKRTIFL